MAWYQHSPEIDGNALLVGASLSEPHTSVTAFAEVVCMYVWVVSCMRMPSPLSRVKGSATARAQRRREEERRRLELTHAWQLWNMTDKAAGCSQTVQITHSS